MDLESNPYDPPRAPIGIRSEPNHFEVAGNWRRFGTYIIDLICYFVVMFGVGIIIGVLYGADGAEQLGLIVNLISFLVLVGYYVFFEGLFGRTPGKFVCGTRVVDRNGNPPSFGQILGRSAARLIPFEPLSFFTARGWHDGLSGTWVILA